MDTCTLLLLLLFAVKALSRGRPNLLRIDCGANLSYTDETDGSHWQADENYIQTGTNEQVSNNSLTAIKQLNNLRAFTQQNKNCYILPTPMRTKYFIRATFYYGNYDHLSRPPTFDLEFDGNKWATVAVTLANPLQYSELIYNAKRDNATVCLARTLDKQFPFISTLEIWPLDDGMYDGMTEDVAWLSSYPYNYGAGSDQDPENWIIGFPIDDYNRVWKPYNPPGTNAVVSDVYGFDYTSVNLPPEVAIILAIEANDPPDAIDLSFPLNKASNRSYVAAYFTEISASVNDSRFIDLYHDDTHMGTLTPEYRNCTEVWAIIQSTDTLNIQLRQNASSALPPIVSAIEVYTASDPLVTSTTSQDDYETILLRIDCGTDSSYVDTSDGSNWQADENYIKTGTNRKVSTSSPSVIEQYNSLRTFTEQNKNCYTLPTPTQAKYFIRCVFYYGNYDGQSKPPTFNLEFDGNKWTSVVTSATQFQIHELVYTPKRDSVSVCLARTQDKQFPFISTLEIWPLDDNKYEGMNGDRAWLTSYRCNYGGGSNDLKNWILGFPKDDYNRVWQPYDPPGTNVVIAPLLSDNSVNDPPEDAILTVIEAADPADGINLPFMLTTTTNLNYIAAYFIEMRKLLDNETRLIDLYVGNNFMLTVEPEIGICTGAWIRIQSDGPLNVQLRQNGSSTLPPMISAIEVYTAGDPLVPSTTLQDDLDGLQVLINAFEQLSGWSGDPCLPNNTVWQWLGCNGNDSPRVIKINLRNNSLNGQIPSFLGTLPNLKQL
ncbi:hypothetical protein BT93_B2180 [Corymbia citriodora subsp. variegata]|nr:hypothetical protein BT93_B2180 [Corymbia citriodora subsp. variegata]